MNVTIVFVRSLHFVWRRSVVGRTDSRFPLVCGERQTEETSPGCLLSGPGKTHYDAILVNNHIIIIIIIIIKLYLYTDKSGTAAPFTGVYTHYDKKKIH